MPAELSPAAPRRPPVSQHWSVRLRDLLSTYVPLLLMLLLAAATWWLVRATPVPAPIAMAEPSPQTPDYTLQGVDLQRYSRDGELLARIRGRELHHFPLGDRLELSDAHIRARLEQGWLDARASQAVVTQSGDRVALSGGVVLLREATPSQPAFEVRGESVEIDIPAGRMSSARPVTWAQQGSTVQAAGFEYWRDRDEVQLRGPVRGILETGKAGRQ